MILFQKVYTSMTPLSFLSKTLEWLAQRQLSAYLESRLYLEPLQTKFRSGHSTQTCLLKLTDDIRLGIEKQHVTLLLLFHFSKAFDSVCHVRLLKNLFDYGLSKLAHIFKPQYRCHAGLCARTFTLLNLCQRYISLPGSWYLSSHVRGWSPSLYSLPFWGARSRFLYNELKRLTYHELG